MTITVPSATYHFYNAIVGDATNKSLSRAEVKQKLIEIAKLPKLDSVWLDSHKIIEYSTFLKKLKPQIETIAAGKDVKLMGLFNKAHTHLTEILLPASFKITPEIKANKAHFLEDEHAPYFTNPEKQLTFNIEKDHTILVAEQKFVKSAISIEQNRSLVLHGEDIELQDVHLNGLLLVKDRDYTVTPKKLTIHTLPSGKEFTVTITTKLYPEKNKAGSGLYQTGNATMTHNEPEGFRRMTYALDQPDILSKYRTIVAADKKTFPILLANGDLVRKEELGNRHIAEYELKYPIPSYIFAMVAGDLGGIEDEFTTMSGRKIKLQAFTDKGQEHRLKHAMVSLKQAMKWDEVVFGREYDLNTLTMVAAKDFNAGAMENKGLLIFNSSCLLASPDTATDHLYKYIAHVIAHEYFHNWTGNRVTVKSWYYLFFKEGLTVFRDQQFAIDHHGETQRIDQAKVVRDRQFPQDAGPTAQALLPKWVISWANLYTLTTYRKGPEIFRMLHTLLGKDKFRKGMDIYFEKNDGKAATAEDFVSAMTEAVKDDPELQDGLLKFQYWFHQAGTPEVNVNLSYDKETQEVKLTVRQKCPPTPETQIKQPFYFPLNVGFLDKTGKEILGTQVIRVSKPEETFVFKGISSEPIPSLLRNFSAPVNLTYNYTKDDLCLLLAHDTDCFNRYDAGQRLLKMEIDSLLESYRNDETYLIDPKVLEAFAKLLKNDSLDTAFRAEALAIPSLSAIVQRMHVYDYDAAKHARDALREALANRLEKDLLAAYNARLNLDGQAVDEVTMGNRDLKNTCLAYLGSFSDNRYLDLVEKQYHSAPCMTERLPALSILCHSNTPAKTKALEDFYKRYKDIPEVITDWFSVQASSSSKTVIDEIRALQNHEAYVGTNPDMIRSLARTLFAGNLVAFNDKSGEGYRFLADEIIRVDKFNSEIAGGYLCDGFNNFNKLNPQLKDLMRVQLQRIIDSKPSDDVYENIAKFLGSEKK